MPRFTRNDQLSKHKGVTEHFSRLSQMFRAILSFCRSPRAAEAEPASPPAAGRAAATPRAPPRAALSRGGSLTFHGQTEGTERVINSTSSGTFLTRLVSGDHSYHHEFIQISSHSLYLQYLKKRRKLLLKSYIKISSE